MTDDPETLLEYVLNALTQANGDPGLLFHQLHQAVPHVRTTAMICALLTADRSMRVMFSENTGLRVEGSLALAAALTLAEAANEAEAAASGHPIRLSDILGGSV